MAVRKSSGKPDRRETRMREFTPADIEAIRQRVLDTATEVQAVGAEMKSRGFKELAIDGASKPDDAIRYIRQFISNAKHAIDRAALER